MTVGLRRFRCVGGRRGLRRRLFGLRGLWHNHVLRRRRHDDHGICARHELGLSRPGRQKKRHRKPPDGEPRPKCATARHRRNSVPTRPCSTCRQRLHYPPHTWFVDSVRPAAHGSRGVSATAPEYSGRGRRFTPSNAPRPLLVAIGVPNAFETGREAAQRMDS